MAEKLSYEEFKEWILEHYKEMLPEDKQSYVAKIHTNIKTNRIYEGMGFLPPSGSSSVSAQMDLNKLYDDYCKSSLDIKKIVGSEIFFVLSEQEKLPHSTQSIEAIKEQFTNYDVMKTKLCMRIVNYESNRELVEESPHKRINDLAIVYSCVVANNNEGISSFRITNDLMHAWGISFEELKADAEYYHQINFKPEFISLRDILIERADVPEYCFPENDFPIYVLTNKNNFFGAAAIACPNVLERIAEKLGGDYSLLPSSIHEMIIVPDSYGANADFLLDMVRTVNSESVPDSEVLSYNTYHYNAVTKGLTMTSRDGIEHNTDDLEF